jgi:hypothetical protein
MLIEVAISTYRNVIKKESEKILKYKDLTIEMQRMWNIKTKVITGITWATEIISKSSKKISEQHPGKAWHKGAKENNHVGRCTHTL